MARGRFLNRKISVSDKLNDLPNDTCRLLATWIIPFLDKNGVYYARPGIVKSTIFTLREDVTFDQVETYLQAMHDIRLIVLFVGKDGKQYQYWPGFEDEQPNLRPDREKTDMPEPPSEGECLALWGADNCQSTDSQLLDNRQSTDSQQPGYLKAKQEILKETESESKSTVDPSVPDSPEAEAQGGPPAPPLPAGDPPPPPQRKTLLPDEIPKPDPVFADVWKTHVVPRLDGDLDTANFQSFVLPIQPIAVCDGIAFLGVSDGYNVPRSRRVFGEKGNPRNKLLFALRCALDGVSDYTFVAFKPGGT